MPPRRTLDRRYSFTCYQTVREIETTAGQGAQRLTGWHWICPVQVSRRCTISFKFTTRNQTCLAVRRRVRCRDPRRSLSRHRMSPIHYVDDLLYASGRIQFFCAGYGRGCGDGVLCEH